MPIRYPATQLIDFARRLLEAAGLEWDKALVVAEVLVEGDLLGHTTHGLQLLPAYLEQLEKGMMTKQGQPRVLADFPAAVTWDGVRLPGPWLVNQAIDLAMERARKLGTSTVVIRRSQHTGCLAAYVKRVTDQGLMLVLSCSDPNFSSVAPHGGKTGALAPDPIAAGWPTNGQPVILDISMSIASMGATRRAHAEGKQLPGAWIIDHQGRPTADPAAMFADPPGALLPIGGMDHGHKGYALALLVEAMAGGLSGHGRADPEEGWSNNVCVQVFDPALFAGQDDFIRQTSWVADACRQALPREGFERVRLPGEAALRRREDQLKNGVQLYPGIEEALARWADKLSVARLV